MADAMTLERFEAQIHAVLAAIMRARSALRYQSHVPPVEPYVRFLAETYCRVLLRRFLAMLGPAWLGGLNAKEAQDVARHLGDLHDKLTQLIQIAETKGFTRGRLHHGFFEQVSSARDRVGDVLEAHHLATNAEFWQLVTECVDGLRSRPIRRDWRS